MSVTMNLKIATYVVIFENQNSLVLVNSPNWAKNLLQVSVPTQPPLFTSLMRKTPFPPFIWAFNMTLQTN